ncbi:DUF4245 domain-containing protein [Tsukamurella sp. 1534]|uniref:DUF4245 domain-containing protein n=1 Tax=Tsukamurella sp. 1534 TaxID=1151061 RepID=UPI0002D31614|nr:DUF4245 domain-containing protein [Tsukamurella sp. 1534]
MAEKSRLLQGRRDLVLTMVPLIALCLLAVFASGNFRFGFGANPDEETVDPIDPKSVYALSAQNLRFPVRMPAGPGVENGVPAEWKATATRDEDITGGTVFTVNYVTPEKNSLQVSQSNAPLPNVVESVFGARASQSGTIPIGARTWAVYGPNEKNRSAWVLNETGAVVVLYGSATVPRFTEIATAIQDQQPLPAAAGGAAPPADTPAPAGTPN